MKNTESISKQLVFVCYQAGTGGENFAVSMSKLPAFDPLEFYWSNGKRTVITNEYFNKLFLQTGKFNQAIDYANTKSLPPRLQAIPSHYDYDRLLPYFPNSRFIRILTPVDELDKIKLKRNLYKKLWLGRLASFAEFCGWCQIYISQERFEILIKQNKIKMGMTFGQLYCVFDNIEPTKDNVKKLFRSRAKLLTYGFTPVNHPMVLNVLPTGFNHAQDQVKKFLAV
jgi:hypothetical protein